MTSFELSMRLARLADAVAIAHLSRDLIEYGLRWRWTPLRVAASIRAADVNVLVACVASTLPDSRSCATATTTPIWTFLPWRRPIDGRGRPPTHPVAREMAVVAGIFNVALEVRAGNGRAQLFYGRLGYRTLASSPRLLPKCRGGGRMGRDLSCRPLDQGSKNTI